MLIYIELAKYSFLRFLTYPLELFSDFIKRFFQVIFLVVFWISISGATQSKSINELLSYFIVISVISDLVMAERLDLAGNIRNYIKSGQLNMILIKPLEVLPVIYADIVGKRLTNFLFSGIAFIIALLINPPQSVIALLYFLIMLVGGILCGIALNILLGTLSFFIVETHQISQAVAQFLRILSGVFVPLYYFPEQLRAVIEKTFIPFLAFKPVDALQITSIESFHITDIIIVYAWAVFLFTAALLFWRKGAKTYEAIGI